MAWARLALLQIADHEQALSTLADVFGYQRKPDERQQDRISATGTIGAKPSFIDEQTDIAPKRPPARFPRVNKMINLQGDADYSQQPGYLTDPAMRLQAADAPPGTYRFADPPPLMPMARLLPFLFNSLAKPKNSSRLDHRLLVRRIEQGRALQRLPKRQRQHWPQRLQIIVDTRQQLQPYWTDFAGIVRQMQTLLGKEAVQALRFDEDSLGDEISYCLPWPTKDHDDWQVWQAPLPDVAILILSDLGIGDHRFAISWQRQLACLQAHTSPILTLSPAYCSPDDQHGYYKLSLNPLNDAYPLPRHPIRSGFAITEPARQKIEDILTWLAPLPLVDTGLLRQLRLDMQWGGSALETLIWNHPNVQDIGLGIQVHANVAKQYQQNFKKRFAATEAAQRFWKIVQAHHAEAYQGLKQLEKFNQCDVEQTSDSDMITYFKGLCASVNQGDSDTSQQQALQLQCRTVLASLSPTIWNSELSDLAYDLFAVAYQDKIRNGQWPKHLDPGFMPERLAWLVDKQIIEKKQLWRIAQTGDQGQIHFIPQSSDHKLETPIAEFTAYQWAPPRLTLPSGEVTPMQQNGLKVTLPEQGTVSVESQAFKLELEAIVRPSWASSIRHNAQGLSATMVWLNQELEVFWQVAKTKANGHWRWPAPFGEDDYGVYVDLTFKNVTQRFRWLEPGTFQMGSPADEPEREWAGDEEGKGSETLHSVTLSQGFWLADTAVTQAFWQAVMGNNPSHFDDNHDNPVEMVSWDDAQNFIEELNRLFPGLLAQLPSEAQWEYACRAGTATPFSFGSNITPEQVNYHGNYPYDNAEPGLCREQTVPVKSLPANPWGFYEMHGNVWEWCADAWQQQMSSESVSDPLMAGGDENLARVVRGGSWVSDGGGVRSAIRNGNAPGSRINFLGFRLALGPVELEPGSGTDRAGQLPASAEDSGSRVAEQRQNGSSAEAGGKFYSALKRFKQSLGFPEKGKK